MKLYINGDLPYGRPGLDLRKLGWLGTREGVDGRVPRPEEIRVTLDRHQEYGMGLIYLLNILPVDLPDAALVAIQTIEQWLRETASPVDVVVELGNEWDLMASPDEARRAWSAVLGWLPTVPIMTGGISSLSNKAIKWLRAALPGGDYCVGFHGYTGNKPPTDYRGSEIQRVIDIAGGRSVWNTETGWHMAPTRSCFRTKPGLTEDQVLLYLQRDVGWHASCGVSAYVVYQLNDGPTNTWQDRYGIRDFPETRWKRQATLPQ